jgi:hypothetical protein
MLAMDSGLENSLLFHARDVLRNKISGRNCSPLIFKKKKKKRCAWWQGYGRKSNALTALSFILYAGGIEDHQALQGVHACSRHWPALGT